MTPHRRTLARRALRRARAKGVNLRWRTYVRTGRIRHRVANGCVALTFDDGPMPGNTDAVLDVLAELDAPATFFCTGENAAAHPDLVRRMLAEGHGVGSHSASHPRPEELGVAALHRDYVMGERMVAAAAYGVDEDPGGTPPRVPLFRPPHGHVSTLAALVMRHMRVSPWLWTVDPEDWRGSATPDGIAALSSRARSGDVVVLHDWVNDPEVPEAQDRSPTIAALPRIVESLRADGLELVVLTP